MMLNPFKSSAFEMAQLQATIDKLPFVPMMVTEMGVFGNEGLMLPVVLIDERQGALQLVNTKPRGAPADQMAAETRNMRYAECTHMPLEDSIFVDDLRGIRDFGSEQGQAAIASLTNNKLAKMKKAIAATIEYMRVQCLKGIIINAKGVTLYNLYTHFGLGTPDPFDFDLGTSGTDIRGKCMDVNKAVTEAMDNVPIGYVQALCGWNFFKRLTGHPDVKEQYKYWSGQNTQDPTKTGFVYGDIVWRYYRGGVGGTTWIDTNECRFFPMGGEAQSIFPTWYGPSTWMSNLGQVGQPLFVKSTILENDTGVKLEVQSNPLMFCLRPLSLRRGHSTT